MYVPAAFAVTDPVEIEAILGRLDFGCLVTHDADGLFASHLPFLYDAERRVLRGHLARANPQWRRAETAEALAIFQGPNAYVSPGWYPSKGEHGRVVPTWNYEVVHVYGRLDWRMDEGWLIGFLAALTDRFERRRAAPWAITDAPVDYVRGLAGAIVGLELQAERVEAKRKLSQNRSEPDRMGVAAALAASDDPSERALGTIMGAEVSGAD